MTRILIIGPAWVGDAVMAQGLYRLLKQRQPHASIDVLAPAWTFSLLNRMPEISNAIELPFTHGELKLKERYQFAKKLKQQQYDQAIVLQNSFKSALIPWFANIPKRTGWVGEFRYPLLNDIRRLDKKRYPLMVEQFLALGLAPNEPLPTPYPYPLFSVSSDSQQAALEKFKPLWRGRPILALCPGAEFGPSKRWPADYYAEVAKRKIQEGWDVWLFGSPKDRPISESITAQLTEGFDDLTGKVGLAESIDLFSLASGIVSNDSGLLHVAAALDKPLIAIYGSTSPAFTPPLSSGAQVLKLNLDCQPCFQRACPLQHHRCMRDLTPERILAAMSGWRT